MVQTSYREETTHGNMPDGDNQDSKTEQTSNRHPNNPISGGSEVRQCAQVSLK